MERMSSSPATSRDDRAVRIDMARLLLPPGHALPRHAFTVDVEDWYQSCIDYDAPITDRVVRNVERMLELLSETGVKATFFVQGMVAEAFPEMVGRLVVEGHEVQSHGYSHRPLHAMNRTELLDELRRAKGTVEDAAGTSVTAFRAQDFSVDHRNLWALEALIEVGFEVDSSIFPMRTRRYGISGWPLAPHHLVVESGARILEAPVAVWSRGRVRVPIAGGGYYRMFPRIVEAGLRSVDAGGRPAIVYCHPYEFNADELADYANVSARYRLVQGVGRRSSADRFRRLFADLPFGRLGEVLEAWGLRSPSS